MLIGAIPLELMLWLGLIQLFSIIAFLAFIINILTAWRDKQWDNVRFYVRGILLSVIVFVGIYGLVQL